MPTEHRTSVVTVFLTRQKELLLLKRSSKVGTFQGCWAGVSGYLEAKNAAEQAWQELQEELGIGQGDAVLAVQGAPLDVEDAKNDTTWVVHPFRFALLAHGQPRLDWEHVESRWCPPETMLELNTVPGLFEAWCHVKDGF